MTSVKDSSAGARKGRAAPSALAQAVAHEQTLAERAAAIRAEHDAEGKGLTGELLMALWPLLREPIPDGFITTIGVVKGKPYESTGIKSVQVQIDRMDHVLTPLGWQELIDYSDEGKLCKVTVEIIDRAGVILCSRSSHGGVNQASTTGNLYKGSYTNAAKVAFARIGPGHEVYVGATDLDPDVHEGTAKAQEQKRATATAPAEPPVSDVRITEQKAIEMVDATWMLGLQDKLQLAASHVVGDDVGDCSNKTAATKAMRTLTPMQAAKVDVWLNRKADEQATSEGAVAA